MEKGGGVVGLGQMGGVMWCGVDGEEERKEGEGEGGVLKRWGNEDKE